MGLTMDEKLLSFQPVEDYIAQWHPDPDGDRQHHATRQGATIAVRWAMVVLDLSRSTVLRYRARGLSYYEADEAATRLGVHPSRIWSLWYGFTPEGDDASYMRHRKAVAVEHSRRLRQRATA